MNLSLPQNLPRIYLISLVGLLAYGVDTPTQAEPIPQTIDYEKPRRFATLPFGAETTGLFLDNSGRLFFNVQHPEQDNPPPFNTGVIGYVNGIDLNQLSPLFTPIDYPDSLVETQVVRLAQGRYDIIARGGERYIGLSKYGLGILVSPTGNALSHGQLPDFNAFIEAGNSGSGYLFTAWETRPGAMSRLKLTSSEDHFKIDQAINIDFRNVAGTWSNCFGTLSPWGTPLTSEELYFPETKKWATSVKTSNSGVARLKQYLGTYPNPYRYGYIVEITQPKSDHPVPKKLYTLGRFSHENAVVMPDERTVYLSDDGTGTVLFKFIADKAGKLNAGTLYAARVTQDNTHDPAKAGFDIKWKLLGKSHSRLIEKWISEYDGTQKTISETEINAWVTGKARDNRVAFLESRKAAAAIGATAEFQKLEGININYAGVKNGSLPYMYLSASWISDLMTDDKGDIQLDENPCGVVYQFKLEKNFDTHRMEPVLAGGPYDKHADNQCAVDNIANPDNLLVLNDGRLVIGEDASDKFHYNNMIWIFRPR